LRAKIGDDEKGGAGQYG